VFFIFLQPPFANPSIDRRLPVAGVQIVLDDLVHKGYAEWTDGAAKQMCSVRCRAIPSSRAHRVGTLSLSPHVLYCHLILAILYCIHVMPCSRGVWSACLYESSQLATR
jgi:hypothetical protein